MSTTPQFIWVEGILGAGKTTLVERLAKQLNYRPIYEPVDTNPYLNLFYANTARWAYPMQVHLLAERFQLQRLAAAEVMTGRGAILDRGLPGDRVFCKLMHDQGHISYIEWQTYQRFYDIMCADLRPPSLLVYLDVQPKTAYLRMVSRQRDCEEGVPLDYLMQLHAGYEEMLAEIESGDHLWSRGTKILRWPWDETHASIDELCIACGT
jgi:deoxyadenosine/deoxycytidine kinase